MNISEIKWLIDENIHNDVITFLREQELDIVYVKEIELKGKPDSVLMPWAYARDRGIITHDSDFGTLAYMNNEPFHVILYLRPGHFDPTFTIETIRQLLESSVNFPVPSIISATRKEDELKIRINKFPPFLQE